MSEPSAIFPLAAPAATGASRRVPAGEAFAWLREGWQQFVAAPGQWVAMALVFLVLIAGVQVVPVFGSLASALLIPVLSAGLLSACQRQTDDAVVPPLQVSEIFAGFSRQTGPLLWLGGLAMLGMLAIVLAAGMLVGGSLLGAGMGGAEHGRSAGLGLALGGILLAMLFVLLALIPLSMALWFAPALVFFQSMPAWAAVKASFAACIRNVWPLSVLGLVLFIAGFFAMLPVGLGLLLLIPVSFGALYASYRAIFVAA